MKVIIIVSRSVAFTDESRCKGNLLCSRDPDVTLSSESKFTSS
jgi:hypothetical protein